MKFCSKCGKEMFDEAVICVSCGCPVEQPVSYQQQSTKKATYEDVVSNASLTNTIAIMVLLAGILFGLAINGWIGAVLLLVAELVALSPATKLGNTFKKNNYNIGSKEENKAKLKALIKDLKEKYPAFKGSYIVAYIALICLIVVVLFFI